MKTDTKDKIVQLITTTERSVKELSDVLDMSTQVIHRHLKNLIEADILRKKGTAPRVVYQIAQKKENKKNTYSMFSIEDVKILDDNFIQILPDGTRAQGLPAFVNWCFERNYHAGKKIEEYITIANKYEDQRINGLLDATKKLIMSFDDQGPQAMWYVDLYSYEIFGKTKLGQLVLYGKSSGDKKIIKEVGKYIHEKLTMLLDREKVDAVVYVPHTIKRPIQFMSEIKKYISIGKRNIVAVEKINNGIAVAQKTLKSKKDRQLNARETFFVPNVNNQKPYDTVLLIDDAVGSGASFYEIGKKLRDQGIAKRVICLGIVGSANSFPIINEA